MARLFPAQQEQAGSRQQGLQPLITFNDCSELSHFLSHCKCLVPNLYDFQHGLIHSLCQIVIEFNYSIISKPGSGPDLLTNPLFFLLYRL